MGNETQPTPVSQNGNVFDSNSIVAAAPTVANYGGGGEWLEYASLLSVGDRFSRNYDPRHEQSLTLIRVELGRRPRHPHPGSNMQQATLPESKLEDAVVTGNAIGPGTTVDLGGGGVYVGCSHLRVLDSTLTLNTAPIGAGIEGEPGDQLELANSIVAEDSPGNEIDGLQRKRRLTDGQLQRRLRLRRLSEPLPGAGNICADPLLADDGDPVSFDVHETASSPTIDAGSNALVPSGLTTDAFGTPQDPRWTRRLHGQLPCRGRHRRGGVPARAQPSCARNRPRHRVRGPEADPCPRSDPFRQPEDQPHRYRFAAELHEHRRSELLRGDLRHLDETLKGKKVVAVGASKRTKAIRQDRPGVVLAGRRATATFQRQAQLDRP